MDAIGGPRHQSSRLASMRRTTRKAPDASTNWPRGSGSDGEGGEITERGTDSQTESPFLLLCVMEGNCETFSDTAQRGREWF